MVGKGSTGAAAVVRVERSEDAYDVVLEDGDELVLAHYDADDWDGAEADAERWAAQVRRLLGAGPGRRERSS